MKIDKAIELNTDSERSLRSHKFPDHADAIALGIEALKLLLENRKYAPPQIPGLLPGETENISSEPSPDQPTLL